MNLSGLSRELREGQSPDLSRRRGIFALSILGVGIAQLVSLYQFGILKKLPDPPIDIFDSNKVNASDYAYKRLQTPDAVFMLFTYASTAWLAVAGGKERAKTMPLVPVLLGLKTLLDCAVNVALGREEYQSNKKLCFYCQSATVVTLITLFLAAPEALRGARALFGSED